MDIPGSLAANETISASEPSWEQIRNLFEINRDFIQLGASQFIASHPRPVSDAIEFYRRKINEQPVFYTQGNEVSKMERIRQACAECMAVPDPVGWGTSPVPKYAIA